MALQKLIENAWKYTRNKKTARIKLGKKQKNDGPVYYIEDNGVGFDMTYKSKLFKPFQRLHSPYEFEGTGIGLATVNRVVQRHGGRIWVKSVKNYGTTFYFTIP